MPTLLLLLNADGFAFDFTLIMYVFAQFPYEFSTNLKTLF